MTLDLDRGSGDNRPRPEGRSHVTVLGTPLKSSAVAAIAGRIADTGANIDRIERMARYPITAIDLHVSGRRPREAARHPGPRGGGAGRRHRRPGGQPAAPRHAPDRDGRRLDPDPGRGHRDARRPRRLRGRGRAGHRAGDARRDRLRRQPPRPGRAARGPGRQRARPGVRRPGARPRRAYDGARAQAARLPLRHRQRRVHPAHRPARRRPRHRLLGGQRARGRRRAGSPGASSARSSTGPARPRRCAGSPPRRASP